MWLLTLLLLAQGPPPPPPPPAFMGMQGLPLACFDKPSFEEDGLEFFVCNGGAGLGGVRKKADPGKTIFVGDVDIALNLNMKVAKTQCAKGRFAVRGSTPYSFECDGEQIRIRDRFQPASKADWKKYVGYLRN
jgi:hypothetical protein